MMQLTVDQVSALAPDASSLSAGRKLSDPKPWRNLGQSEAALWGECQGSAIYQVKVDLAAFAFNCSCPSRKLPCKHVLGLLLLAAQSRAAVAQCAHPEWVDSWLAKRAETAKRRDEKQQGASAAKPVDAEAQAKRAQKRSANVADGIAQLDLWMNDLVRGGLAGLERKPPSFWEEQARRLVDAQAKGLALRVRRLGEVVGAGSDWPAEALGELGRMALLTHAYDRLELLDRNLQADVRQMIGWTTDSDELQTGGDRVSDRWLVLGQTVGEEERLRVQRSWLVGLSSGRTSLVLQFSFGKQPFADSIVPAAVIDGDLAFYPSAFPQRARLAVRRGDESHFRGKLAGCSLATMLEQVAQSLARFPWLERSVVTLDGVRIAPGTSTWHVCDASNRAVPLAGRDHWTLLAISGGRPFTLTGLWNGTELEPLGMFDEDVYLAVSQAASHAAPANA